MSCRILDALKPKTKSIASITFDLPLPLGPTTDEKHCRAAGQFGARGRA